MATDTERASWRKAFDMVGPASMRLRLEHRRNEFAPDYAREAELWLLEKDAEAQRAELRRSTQSGSGRLSLRWRASLRLSEASSPRGLCSGALEQTQ